MIFKNFELLKNSAISGNMQSSIAANNTKSVIEHLLKTRSVTSLKLFCAIFGMYETRCVENHSFFQDSIDISLCQQFDKDPSDFFVVFLYALSVFSKGESKRAEQLLVRLIKSGWKNKELAVKIYSLLVRKMEKNG